MDECTAKDLIEEWDAKQIYLFSKLITSDTEPWQLTKDLKLVGGFDLSFFKEEPSRAVATLVVCKLPGLEVVYEDSNCISLFHPYIPGYLAFREAGPCLEALTKLKQTYPDLYPQVLLVDGNGILHPRGLGLASHVGILADLPTIGVAKNLYQMEELARNQEHKAKIQALEAGCHFLIIRQGKTLGAVLRTVVSSYKPVYVSIGHKISLETALHCIKQCSTKYRIPHPLRESDIRSRAFVRRLLN